MDPGWQNEQPCCYSSEALHDMERELLRNGHRFTLPQCDDGTLQVVKNKHQCVGLRDAEHGETLDAHIIRFEGEKLLRHLTGDGRPEAYRCVHLDTTKRVGPKLTPDKLMASMASTYSRLRTSFNHELEDIKAMLSQNAEAVANVDKVVAFGLGRLEGPSDGLEHSIPTLAMSRHMVVYNIVHFIRTEISIHKRHLIHYTQDSTYTGLDKKLLAEKWRMTPVEGFGAAGFLLIDGNTIVINYEAGLPVREIVLDIARPAAMWVRDKSKSSTEDPCPSRISEAMKNEYVEYSIPATPPSGDAPVQLDYFPENRWYFRRARVEDHQNDSS
ncbi:putative SRR1-like domain-containing protein [Seiridium cardinale]|uniref:SRR1-like domain-containing protein n=1 Tax=Seiridium cardinale TaxID=138064 RepID=A0ABR2XJY1_9PEZI